MDMEEVELLVFPAVGDPEKKQVVANLESLQSLVGGMIEPVALQEKYGEGDLKTILRAFGLTFARPIALVNEEGLLFGLPRNRWFPQFVGSVVVMDNKDLK